mmetsp:Transcript_57954/g.149124  ORF Transcript_57954/g.149124 Transcript_57954/m.149124 type:complete len:219 (-) Transcript_57954:683-1339(-)
MVLPGEHQQRIAEALNQKLPREHRKKMMKSRARRQRHDPLLRRHLEHDEGSEGHQQQGTQFHRHLQEPLDLAGEALNRALPILVVCGKVELQAPRDAYDSRHAEGDVEDLRQAKLEGVVRLRLLVDRPLVHRSLHQLLQVVEHRQPAEKHSRDHLCDGILDEWRGCWKDDVAKHWICAGFGNPPHHHASEPVCQHAANKHRANALTLSLKTGPDAVQQ